jgi:signal peptidase I
VKRCIAIPGDTFYIENGIYKIKGYQQSTGDWQNQQLLSQMSDETIEKHIFNCFPNDTAFCWNIKNFGPLYIPGKGETLELNQQNIALYSPLIQYETEKMMTVKEGQLFLGEEPLLSYTFMHNYYFMAGDCIVASNDSRYWGLLPEDYVVGKATFIWKSVDPETGKFRWKRFLKVIK